MNLIKKTIKPQRVTAGSKHYFFGYFDKFPWSIDQRYILAHQTEFMGRQPEPEDQAVIGMIDTQNNNEFIPLSSTSAWCWQQGAMLQWLNDDPDTIIFNDREGDKFVARTLNVKTGTKSTLHRPIYCLSSNGRHALSVNFSRLDKERPGYGYAGVEDEFSNDVHPENDGIWLVDLKNDTSKLILSLARIAERFNRPEMDIGMNWFNHLLFSPNGERFAFFHRWRLPNGRHLTHMFTADLDGDNLHPLNLQDMSSHYTWIDDKRIIGFANQNDTSNYYEFTDLSDEVRPIGGDRFVGRDGHCSYSSDGKWMLTDSYPDPTIGSKRRLFLVDLSREMVYEIGQFFSPPTIPAPCRCDLHPNWSRDCREICFDSLHEGQRHVYTMNVSEVMDES